MLYINMEYDGWLAAVRDGHSKTMVNRLKKRGFKRVGEQWIKEFLPIHFTEVATARYGYAYRSKSYVRKKKKLRGNAAPLVYSGQSKTLSRLSRVSATSKKATVRIPARTLNRHNPKSKADMRAEVTKVLPIELVELKRTMVNTFTRGLGQVKAKRTIRINNRLRKSG